MVCLPRVERATCLVATRGGMGTQDGAEEGDGPTGHVLVTVDEAAGQTGRQAGAGPDGGASAQRLCGRFCDDIAWMTGRRPGLYWRLTWKVISPLLLLTILVAYIALLAHTPPSYRAWDPGYVSPLCGAPGALGFTAGPAWPWRHPGSRWPSWGTSVP